MREVETAASSARILTVKRQQNQADDSLSRGDQRLR
jgi:hypothetical protein